MMERIEIKMVTFNLLDEARSLALRSDEIGDGMSPIVDFGYVDISKKVQKLYGKGADINLDFKYSYISDDVEAPEGLAGLDKGGVVCNLATNLNLHDLELAPPENSLDFIIYLHLVAHKIIIRRILEKNKFFRLTEAWILGEEISAASASYAILLNVKSVVKEVERQHILLMIAELFQVLLDSGIVLDNDMLMSMAELSVEVALGGLQ